MSCFGSTYLKSEVLNFISNLVLQTSISVLFYHHSTLYIVGKVVYTYFMYKSRSAQDVIFVYNNTITMYYINGSIGTSPSFFEGFGLIYTSNWKFLISFLSFVLHSLKVSWYIYCFISSVYFYVIHWIDKHCLSYHSSQANSLHHDNYTPIYNSNYHTENHHHYHFI